MIPFVPSVAIDKAHGWGHTQNVGLNLVITSSNFENALIVGALPYDFVFSKLQFIHNCLVAIVF
jgi:hypothetical protein